MLGFNCNGIILVTSVELAGGGLKLLVLSLDFSDFSLEDIY